MTDIAEYQIDSYYEKLDTCLTALNISAKKHMSLELWRLMPGRRSDHFPYFHERRKTIIYMNISN